MSKPLWDGDIERLINQSHARGQFANDYQRRAEAAEAEIERLNQLLKDHGIEDVLSLRPSQTAH